MSEYPQYIICRNKYPVFQYGFSVYTFIKRMEEYNIFFETIEAQKRPQN